MFVPYNVDRVTGRDEKPLLEEALNEFLGDIPVASLWPTKRAELHLSEVRMNHLAVVILLGGPRIFGPPKERLNPLIPSLSSNITFKSLNAYAHKTKVSLEAAKSAAKLARCQELVFISMCNVFLHLGYSITLIHQAICACFGPRHPKSFDRLLRGALWANRCIALLFDKGWDHRSTEDFLLCKTSSARRTDGSTSLTCIGGRPVTFYARLSDYKESSKLLEEHLTRAEYKTPLDEAPEWIPYSIPCIIKTLVGDALT